MTSAHLGDQFREVARQHQLALGQNDYRIELRADGDIGFSSGAYDTGEQRSEVTKDGVVT